MFSRVAEKRFGKQIVLQCFSYCISSQKDVTLLRLDVGSIESAGQGRKSQMALGKDY